MTLRTLLEYLVGRRRAILEIASSRGALGLGALFVLSAAFAREYDGESLAHEPWHLLIPFGASLATSFGLFCVLTVFAGLQRTPALPFWKSYRSFLGLYWMTAPLAWLYAIPVERFLTAGDAAAVNLTLLGVVAAWRVLLMIRVVSVLFGTSAWAAAMPVMLFADAVVLVLLFSTPIPVISFMGGVRLSEREEVIQGTAILVGLAAFLTLPVWLVGTSVAVWAGRRFGSPPVPASPAPSKVSHAVWVVGALSVAVWLLVLPITQPEQQRRWRAERDLREGRISEALQFMSAHKRADFPPHWDPPPRIAYGETKPPFPDVLETIVGAGVSGWVRDVYLDKLARRFDYDYWFWHEIDDEARERYLSVFEELPEGPQVIAEHRERFQWTIRPHASDSERERSIQERLERLLGTDPPAAVD